MRLMLILLSVITINCQNVNENSTTQSTVHFLPIQMAVSSSSGGEDNDDDGLGQSGSFSRNGSSGGAAAASVAKDELGLSSNQQHSTFHVSGSGTGSIIDVAGAGGTSTFNTFGSNNGHGMGIGGGGVGTGSGQTGDSSRSRIIETKYGRVQGLSITIAQGKVNPLKNKYVEVRDCSVIIVSTSRHSNPIL
jgi:hypothetical protein